ncbi:MAG: PAS domain S-box protein, partial [Alphaproteobacteria bacterium]|nr:PAS domain S-box protein [Alphaproteobacteria bacterium]
AITSHTELVKTSEARLDGFFANAPVGMAIFDDRLRSLKVNDLLAAWSGVAPGDHMGKTVGETFPALESLEDAGMQDIVRTSQPVWDLELAATLPSRPDQKMTWLVNLFPIRGASGNLANVGAIAMDITERKQAEEDLAHLNEHLEQRVEEQMHEVREAYQFNDQVISTSPVGISLYDPDGHCIIANEAVAEMIGATREQALAQNWLTIESWRRNGLRDAAESALVEGARKRLEVSLVSTFGKSVHLDCYFVPVWREGELHLMFVVNDISERKRAEETLKSVQLELLRKERLAVLGQLTGTVAHELRNPLGALVNSMTVIRHKSSAAGLDLKAVFERTDRSVKRCERIITDLLDFARATGIQRESVVLDNWLSDILDEQDIPEATAINANLQTDGATVRFDPDELRRAVINVVDNACQAMGDGNRTNGTAAGELTVTSRINGERVEIEIMDTGPGIPEDILPQVTEPLFSTKSFGTGLGMPTVLRIMEEHGGGLGISSQEGRGTQVTLWWPLDDENGEKEDQ